MTTTCTRTGCTKTLRKDNAKGVCSSNCGSPEAPPAQRAKGVKAPTALAKNAEIDDSELTHDEADEAPGTALKKFREVAEVVGLDADKVLEEFAQSWLAGLREKLA